MSRLPWRALGFVTLVLLACGHRGAAQAPKKEEQAPKVSLAPKDADIAEAIKKGVHYLKALQQKKGTWPRQEIGATALAAWTLLECGVDPTDPCIQKAAHVFRESLPKLDHSYSLALGVFFLDRLGDEADIPLIEAMALRLMTGQNGYGGWDYTSPLGPPQEVEFLTNYVKEMQAGTLNPKAPKDRKRRTFAQVTPLLQQRVVAYLNAPPPARNGAPGDNSNTQFAMMAMWVARRYGIPTERALLMTEKRFREYQYQSGGWGYDIYRTPYDPNTPDSGPHLGMTAAGLLAIALSQASNPLRAKEDLSQDKQVKAAFTAVASTIGNPVGDISKVPSQAKNGRVYYALWSLVRMAVVYGLEKHKIGTKDWFGWGAELLVASQSPSGAWQGKYDAGGCDTCFALLFLTRANVAVDLTNKVKVKPIEVKENPRLIIPDLPNIVSKDDPKSKTKETPKKMDSSAKALAEQLVEAAPAKQEEVLKKFKDAHGASYTEALAQAIAKLKGEGKIKARATLMERMTLMPAASLTGHLKSEQVELRRAAALAAGAKKSRAHIIDLIHLLEDGETPVANAAHRALVQITGQDFGPEDDATRAERAEAARAWRKWQKSK